MATSDQDHGTTLENLSLKAGGEALSDPNKKLKWKDIIAMPGAEMAQKLFGFGPVTYEWNPYLEESIYEN
jgi:hypothetical protein